VAVIVPTPLVAVKKQPFVSSTCALASGRGLASVLSALAFASALAVSSQALAKGKDAEATKLADQAIQDDYLATRFDVAIKKLKKAINLCKKGKCSDGVVARLHRDLGTVYIAGQNKLEPGKAELKKAVELDPEIELDESLSTPELQSAFEEVGGKRKPEPPPEEPTETLEETPPPPPPVEEEDDGGVRRNWVSLGVMQDFLIHSSVDFACPDMAGHASPDYRCFAGDAFITEPVYDGGGNKISGGVGIATTRLLLGYDRLFGDRWLAGARLGFAFGGGPAAPGSSSFTPLHLEGRIAAYFGAKPFERTSLRPYAALAGGFAQLMDKVPVDIFLDQAGAQANQPYSVDAWRRAGNLFVSLGLGASLPIDRSMLSAEARFMQLLGTSGSGFSLGLSYAYGL
jgi:hypothetical protein